jgi:c-di-GMP-binding flagellar brake protein YcgR
MSYEGQTHRLLQTDCMRSPANRRRFPRIAASVFYRPAGPDFLHHRRATVDISLGGMRVYSDDDLKVGSTLEIDLLLDKDTTARCWARIAWIEKLPESAGAAYDIGLEFTDIEDEDRRRLTEALKAGT